MPTHPKRLPWPYIQSFAAVAKHGSLSSGAAAIGGSQPTMSRHISMLEQALGVRLFDRTGGGLALTETGIDLLQYAEEMDDAAYRLAVAASGRSETLEGTVRITATIGVAAFMLPPILTRLRRAEPNIDIELVASDRTDNLLLREADIAVRMYRPKQADVITRKVGVVPFGMFASNEYIARNGEPKKAEDLMHHNIIGRDRSNQTVDALRAAGFDVDRNLFSFRCDDQTISWMMVLAGYGIGFNHLRVGQGEPRVTQVFPSIDALHLPVWLTAHAELKTSRRVRCVYDFLASEITEMKSTGA